MAIAELLATGVPVITTRAKLRGEILKRIDVAGGDTA